MEETAFEKLSKEFDFLHNIPGDKTPSFWEWNRKSRYHVSGFKSVMARRAMPT